MNLKMYENKILGKNLIAIEEKISGNILDVMYLVIGTKKAALIDSGMGLNKGLYGYIKSLTQLPIIVLNTHCHPDHVGSNFLFEQIYMNKLDDDLISWALSYQTRLEDSKFMWNPKNDPELNKHIRENAVEENKFIYKDISDGGKFDLGQTILEAISTPGHTKGSMCFINESENYIFVGDTIISTPWLWLEHCTTISEYVKSLKKVKNRIDSNYKLYCGHIAEALPYKIVDELIEAGEEVINGNTDNDIPFNPPLPQYAFEGNLRTHSHKNINLAYDLYNVK